MFEKSLYDLIRGLRNHKGNEREYIQDSLRECRKEIKSQDMDLKATALLKLTYLEMFGHDMSWASFNVLEVMSSQKYLQKRVGYLAAVQSFRPDTEVLMLAENLLKKDLMSPAPTTIALPLMAIPHVVNPSMANSLLSDLLPRLTHSHAAIRKKTIVTLYRLALVYPETLRPAWPKIKERLSDENEDPSVTSAIVNVVCELGWRRPQDFLPLAPRLFDLLVQRNNNWMAIKIIKLFATLTPLEPRLIKKLLPPLTEIIKTTPAMSLLYECINGIIQGGILEGAEGTTDGEEIARLCVGKLRGMLVVEGDPNLKYVALLAFQKIVTSHPHLVSLHQDVILDCIDDPDISIRMRALDLVVGMVNGDNLTTIVGRLMRQLRNAPIASTADDPTNDRGAFSSVQPAADDTDDSEAEESLRANEKRSEQPPPLPEDYRITVIKRILEMCSRDTYTNVTDFDWYIDVLVQLVRVSPAFKPSTSVSEVLDISSTEDTRDVSYDIGSELQNVAVRVRSVRPEATQAAQSLVLVDLKGQLFPTSGNGGQGVLESAAWIVGEYAEFLSNLDGVLTSLLHASSAQLPAHILAIYLQAIPKVFANLVGNQQVSWTSQRRNHISLLLARLVHFLESLASHPNLEVQERAVEYLELMRLAAEALSGQNTSSSHQDFVDPPLLLTQAIPSLFSGMELNPVAPGAQKKVPKPDDLDLDTPINERLQSLLQKADRDISTDTDEDDIYHFYNERPTAQPQVTPAADRLDIPNTEPTSYQQSLSNTALDPSILAKRKADRRERHKDDPFYIPSEHDSGTSTPIHNIIKHSNGDELDIDAIPIMDLQLDSRDRSDEARSADGRAAASGKQRRSRRAAVEIIVDETIGPEDATSSSDVPASRPDFPRSAQGRGKKSVLEVDSSGLGSLSLESGADGGVLDVEQREAEERALREVERLRLEMQRAAERIHAREGVVEAVVVRRKKAKKKERVRGEGEGEGGADEGGLGAGEAPAGGAVAKKKKKKKVREGDMGGKENAEAKDVPPDGGTGETVKVKKKKRRQVVLDESGADAAA